MSISRPFGNIGQIAYLNQLTTETRTRVVGDLLPQRGFNPRIHSALNFHRGISRIPNIRREAVHPPVPRIPPNFYVPVEDSKNTKGPTTIEPSNALGLFYDTPPSIPNVESLSTTLSPLALGFLTPLNETYTEETHFSFEPLGSGLNLFRQNSQTTEPSPNSSQPFIEPNNALGLYGPQHHILDVQSSSANTRWSTIEPHNALGLSLGHPSIGIESLLTSPPVPLEFRDDAYPKLPSSEQLNANFDFYGEDLQIGANLRKLTIEPNFHQTQPESSSHMPQDIRWGDVGMWDIARRNLIPNPTPWEIEVPPPGPLKTNFNPFWDLSNTDSDSGSGSSYEAVQELSVTFGGKFGRQVRWRDIMPSVDHFIECCARETTHSLSVVLEPSCSPYDQWERRRTLKQLFDRLQLTESATTCADERHVRNVVFNRICMTVPDKAEDKDMTLVAFPWINSSGRTIPNANWEKIDIRSASNLREFLWNGPFQQLSENFLYPADGLTLLSITGCEISVNDAVELLRPCSSLEEVQLETVHDTQAVASLTPKSGAKFKFTLSKLLVTSSVDLAPLLKLITWTLDGAELILDNDAQDANALSYAEFIPKHVVLNLKRRFLKETMDELQAMRS
jgi:hypothetical protein